MRVVIFDGPICDFAGRGRLYLEWVWYMKLTNEEFETRTVGCVFVGNPLCFSDTTLTLVETALPCISCERTASANDLLLMGRDRSEATRLIVVDECKSDELIRILPRLCDIFPLATIAVAYRHVDRARTYFAAHQSTPSFDALGFLPMNMNVDSWLSVVRLLAAGESYLPKELYVQGPIAEAAPAQQEADAAPSIHLTARELQVLKSAAEGKQNKIIADELKLSQHTVKLHMHHVIAKLGVHNRTEAANWFYRHNLGT